MFSLNKLGTNMDKLKQKRKHIVEPLTPEMHFDAVLAEGLQFNQKDLSANRHGVMTLQQRQALEDRIIRTHASAIVIVSIFVAVMILLGAGMIVPAVITNNFGHPEQSVLTIFTGLMLIISMIVLFYGFVVNKLRTPVLERDKLIMAEMGTILIPQLDRNEEPYVLINKRKFRLSRYARMHFRHLDRYIIYYTPESKIVLSAEPLTE